MAYVAVLLQGSTAPVQSAGTPALSGKLLRCRLGPRPAAGPLHRFCTDEPAEPEEEESSLAKLPPAKNLPTLPRHTHAGRPVANTPCCLGHILSHSYHLITKPTFVTH